MEWGDESTIGYNAGGDYYQNHPITGHFQSHLISCLQNISNNNLITNIIYDLVPDVNALLPGAIPPYHNTIGTPHCTSTIVLYPPLSLPRFLYGGRNHRVLWGGRLQRSATIWLLLLWCSLLWAWRLLLWRTIHLPKSVPSKITLEFTFVWCNFFFLMSDDGSINSWTM